MMKLSIWMLGISLVVLGPACGKSSGGSGGGGSGAMSSMGASSMGMEAMSTTSMGTMSSMGMEAMRPANTVTDGPTGVAECDRALDIVCRCAKQQVSLRRPCKTLKEDAPRWKTKARNQDPQQHDEVRTSCTRILTSIQAAYGCK